MEEKTKKTKSFGIQIGEHIHFKSLKEKLEENRQAEIKRIEKLKTKLENK